MCYFVQGLRLFKGLHLLFLQYVPGGTFIQGATFIPESRIVSLCVQNKETYFTLQVMNPELSDYIRD